MAFAIPTYELHKQAATGATAIWVHHTSPTIPTNTWGGIAIRSIPFATSYEWWALYEFKIDTSWNTAADGAQYVLPFESHGTATDPSWSGVSPMHVKYENGNLMLQHQPNSPSHEWTVISSVTKGVWHSIVGRFIYGRLDGTVSATGHPNGGMGRTRIWYDGNDTPFDTGNINNITRVGAALDANLVILEGNYSEVSQQMAIASFTAGRWGKTLSEALADSAITKTGDQGVGGGNFYTTLTSRQDTDFVLPPSLGGGTPPPTPTHLGPWVTSVQYNSDNTVAPPTVFEQHIGPWTTNLGYNSSALTVGGNLVLEAESATTLTLTPEVEE
jgi:hypothetical protein